MKLALLWGLLSRAWSCLIYWQESTTWLTKIAYIWFNDCRQKIMNSCILSSNSITRNNFQNFNQSEFRIESYNREFTLINVLFLYTALEVAHPVINLASFGSPAEYEPCKAISLTRQTAVYSLCLNRTALLEAMNPWDWVPL